MFLIAAPPIPRCDLRCDSTRSGPGIVVDARTLRRVLDREAECSESVAHRIGGIPVALGARRRASCEQRVYRPVRIVTFITRELRRELDHLPRIGGTDSLHDVDAQDAEKLLDRVASLLQQRGVASQRRFPCKDNSVK